MIRPDKVRNGIDAVLTSVAGVRKIIFALIKESRAITQVWGDVTDHDGIVLHFNEDIDTLTLMGALEEVFFGNSVNAYSFVEEVVGPDQCYIPHYYRNPQGPTLELELVLNPYRPESTFAQ